MKPPKSVATLTEFGRARLSRSFFMRDFLYSEIGNLHRIPNIPDDPDLAITAGRHLCETLLEPLQDTFGRIAVRSAFRSCAVNGFGSEQQNAGKAGYNCGSNAANCGGHIWDRRDAEGQIGATACVVIPWFADQYGVGRDWRDLAYWVHDHLPYSSMYFFPKLAAFNLTWRATPVRKISSYIAPAGTLLGRNAEPDEPIAQRRQRYADFPAFRGQKMPPIPTRWYNAAQRQ